RRGGAQRAPRRVQGRLCAARRRDSRSARRAHLLFRQARLGRARRRGRETAPPPGARAAGRAAPQGGADARQDRLRSSGNTLRRRCPAGRLDASRRSAAAARQRVRREHAAAPRLESRRADLGRWAGRDAPALVRVLEHRDGVMDQVVAMSTYRLQLTAAFGFRAAAAIVPYLRRLGITHVYASPILQSRRGSTHGYDMVDATRIDDELGGEAGLAELIEALRTADMGLVVDFVPNHMGVLSPDNPWWLDVLEWGRASPHARDFDIEWKALRFDPRDKLLLP